VIIVFGPAGSGKSTQGQLLAEKYNWKWLSIGQLLRDMGDEKLKAKMKTGELIEDQFVVGVMSQAVQALNGGMAILDGYPRNSWQAQWLVDHQRLDKVQAILVFDGDRDDLRERLKLRGREDDNDEAIKDRFALYDREFGEIMPILESANIPVVEIESVGTIEEVHARVVDKLREQKIVVV